MKLSLSHMIASYFHVTCLKYASALTFTPPFMPLQLNESGLTFAPMGWQHHIIFLVCSQRPQPEFFWCNPCETQKEVKMDKLEVGSIERIATPADSVKMYVS